jgi:gliding motility-associated-like protein
MGLEVELEVLDSSDDICELGMGEMLVQATSGTAPFTFNWANSSSVSTLGTNLLTGLQSVVATDFNGCQGEISYFIENIPPPIAEFTYLLDSCTNELTLFNETDDIVSSLWKVGENLTSTQQHTSVSLHEGGVYPVTLITANEYCADTLTNVIDLTHTSAFNRIKFANVFTPNGDLTNDYFTIRGLKDCDHGVFRIFNRWGKEMYYSIDPLLEPWDGNHLGFEVSEGAYFYVLDLKTIQLKGVLNLYR